MALTDSNKLYTKVLHKLKVKLHFDWLTPQLTGRTTRKIQEGHTINHHSKTKERHSHTPLNSKGSTQLRKTKPQLTVTPQISVSNQKIHTDLCFTQPIKLINNVCTTTIDHQCKTPIGQWTLTHNLIKTLTQLYSHTQITKQLIQISDYK